MKTNQFLKAIALPWAVLWGAVAVDSALAARRSRQAIEEAIEADPIVELYDGPPSATGRIRRWLFWSAPTLPNLRAVERRAGRMTIGAPLIALAAPLAFLGLKRASEARARAKETADNR